MLIFAPNLTIKVMGLDIKRVIKQYGLEAKDVASRMGITPVGLSQHMNGNPSVAVLQRIADAIGCDIGEFFVVEKEQNSITCPKCGARFKLEE